MKSIFSVVIEYTPHETTDLFKKSGLKMTLAILAIIFGIFTLVKSADLFVEGASGTAKYFGMSEFLIGMLILGFGTSAPELLVSASASIDGNGALALGNAYGSNIANIALILGVTAIISPVVIQKKIVNRDMPLLLGITVLSACLLWDYSISRIDAWILLAVFLAFTVYSIRTGKSEPDKKADTDLKKDEKEKKPIVIWKEIIKLTAGLVILVGSSKLLVWGAVEIAHILKVSDLLIGLTVVAIGTSLPELASSVTASIKGNNDMAIGFNFTYLPERWGIYGSLLGGFSHGYASLGPALRLSDNGDMLDWHLYGGVMVSNHLGGELGLRMAAPRRDGRFCWESLSIGVGMVGRHPFLTCGLSLEISAFTGLYPLFW